MYDFTFRNLRGVRAARRCELPVSALGDADGVALAAGVRDAVGNPTLDGAETECTLTSI